MPQTWHWPLEASEVSLHFKAPPSSHLGKLWNVPRGWGMQLTLLSL